MVFAGLGVADHARAGIQLLSPNPQRATIFTHSGWREIGDRHVYLHGGGAIGADGNAADIRVELPPALAPFKLELPEDPQIAIRASLRLLDLAEDRITVPLYGQIWRALLGDADFSIFLYGATGNFKTECAALTQSHFGRGFDARHLPASFEATANSNEELMFVSKDAVLVIDELHPAGGPAEREKLQAHAARVFRSAGNRAGRGRMKADGSTRAARPPRCAVLGTGEELSRGHSGRARCLILEIDKGDVRPPKLTLCQEDAAAGLYAQATATFVRWQASRFAEVQASFKETHKAARARLRAAHPRTADAIAQLVATYSLFMEFLLDQRILAQPEAAAFQRRIGNALEQVSRLQRQFHRDAEPIPRFVDLLMSAVGAGRAHLADLKAGAPEGRETACGWRLKTIGVGEYERDEWQPQGDCVGWIEGDDLFLDRDAAYRIAQSMVPSGGAGIGVEVTTLVRALRENNLLVATDTARRTSTVRKTILGALRDVLHLRAEALGLAEKAGGRT